MLRASITFLSKLIEDSVNIPYSSYERIELVVEQRYGTALTYTHPDSIPEEQYSCFLPSPHRLVLQFLIALH